MCADRSLELSLWMAYNLKNLRENSGKSRNRVIDEMSQQMDVTISLDSLSNYEQTDMDKRGALSNIGMSVEKLSAFADYYGVSTDYILGRADFQNKENETVTVKDLGFTEASVDTIRRIMSNDQHRIAFEHLLLSPYFSMLLDEIYKYKMAMCANTFVRIADEIGQPYNEIRVENEDIRNELDPFLASRDENNPAAKHLNKVYGKGSEGILNVYRFDAQIALNMIIDKIGTDAAEAVRNNDIG